MSLTPLGLAPIKREIFTAVIGNRDWAYEALSELWKTRYCFPTDLEKRLPEALTKIAKELGREQPADRLQRLQQNVEDIEQELDEDENMTDALEEKKEYVEVARNGIPQLYRANKEVPVPQSPEEIVRNNIREICYEEEPAVETILWLAEHILDARVYFSQLWNGLHRSLATLESKESTIDERTQAWEFLNTEGFGFTVEILQIYLAKFIYNRVSSRVVDHVLRDVSVLAPSAVKNLAEALAHQTGENWRTFYDIFNRQIPRARPSLLEFNYHVHWFRETATVTNTLQDKSNLTSMFKGFLSTIFGNTVPEPRYWNGIGETIAEKSKNALCAEDVATEFVAMNAWLNQFPDFGVIQSFHAAFYEKYLPSLEAVVIPDHRELEAVEAVLADHGCGLLGTIVEEYFRVTGIIEN